MSEIQTKSWWSKHLSFVFSVKNAQNFSVERKADWSKYSYSKCALRPPTREASRGGDLARSQKDVCFTKTSCLLRTDAGARAATQLQKTGSPKFSKLALILLGFQFPYFPTQKAKNLQDTFTNSNDWHFQQPFCKNMKSTICCLCVTIRLLDWDFLKRKGIFCVQITKKSWKPYATWSNGMA